MADPILTAEQSEKLANIEVRALAFAASYEKGEISYGSAIHHLAELMGERRNFVFGDAHITSMKSILSDDYVAEYRPLKIISQGKDEIESLHALLDAVVMMFIAHARRGTTEEWLRGLGVNMDPKGKL